MAQVVAGPHRLEQGANRAEQRLSRRPATQQKVVAPHRVIGLQGGEVFAVAAGAAPFGPQMVDQGGWFVVDAPTAVAPAVGELGFKVIGHLHEVGVEATQAAGAPQGDGHIAPHECLQAAGFEAVEQEGGAGGILPLAVPWLQYPAGHHCLGIQFAGALVGPQQVGVGADVVVEEKDPIAVGLEQGPVHGTGDRGALQAQPADIALFVPAGQLGLRVGIVARGLVHDQELPGGRIEGQKVGDAGGEHPVAAVGGDGNRELHRALSCRSRALRCQGFSSRVRSRYRRDRSGCSAARQAAMK